MLLDIALGFIATYLVLDWWGVTPIWWHLGIGTAFALLPDVDAIWHYVRTRQIAAHAGSPKDHRDGLHYPLLYIPVGSAVFYITTPTAMWGDLFVVASVLHFLHDSVGTGWGVKWLWPITKKSYKAFCEKDGTPSRRPVVSWTPEEKREAMASHGDPDWIQNLFLRPLSRGEITPGIVVEFLLPLIAIALVVANQSL